MSRSELRFTGCMIAAILAPFVMANLAIGESRRLSELSVAPFAWRPVFAAHLIAALPFAIYLAARLRALPELANSVRWPWLLLGLILPVVLGTTSSFLGQILLRNEWGFFPLLLLRSALAILLVFPWCFAGVSRSEKLVEHQAVSLLILFALSIVPCYFYTTGLRNARTQETQNLIAQSRLLKAEAILTGLIELGGEQPIGDKSPGATRKLLNAQLSSLRLDLAEALPTNAAASQRLARAIQLVKLERLDGAAEVLAPIVAEDAVALQMLAGIYRNQKRLLESDQLYRQLLDKSLASAAGDGQAQRVCQAAYDGLAENATSDNRTAEAEDILQRGLQNLPNQSAFFHFRLGQLYHNSSRFELAIEHLDLASKGDPKSFAKPVDELMQQIRTSTPGCLLRWFR